MICPNCNTNNNDDATICRNCNFKLDGGDYFEAIPELEFYDYDFEDDGYVEPVKENNKSTFVEKDEFYYMDESYKKEQQRNISSTKKEKIDDINKVNLEKEKEEKNLAKQVQKEIKRQEEAKRQAEEAKRKAEYEKRKAEELKRQAEEAKRQAEELKRQAEEAKRKAEEANNKKKNNEPQSKKVQPINPTKKNNNSKIFIPIGVVLLCAVFAFGFFKGRDSSSDNPNSGEVYDSSYEGDAYSQDDGSDYNYDSNSSSGNGGVPSFSGDKFEGFYESGTPIDVAFIDSSNVQKYLNYNYPESFNTYFADGYSFGYPSNFYNRAEELAYGYKFSADNGAFLYMTVTPCSIATEDLEDEMDKLYKKYDNMLYESETVVYKYDASVGYTRFILSGFEGPDKATANYIFCNVKNDKIEFYHLRNILKGYSKEEGHHTNYILDTIYRMCSFSGTSYKPRTFNQLMNNEMGEKK